MTATCSPTRSPCPRPTSTTCATACARTRWPERETVDDWSQGIPLAYVQELCADWADGYDWRRVEAELNRFEQLRFVPEVGAPDRLGIQVLHAPSPRPRRAAARAHPRLAGLGRRVPRRHRAAARPARHGGDPADAFHVVCPTMPGYGFSDKPTRDRAGTSSASPTPGSS